MNGTAEAGAGSTLAAPPGDLAARLGSGHRRRDGRRVGVNRRRGRRGADRRRLGAPHPLSGRRRKAVRQPARPHGRRQPGYRRGRPRRIKVEGSPPSTTSCRRYRRSEAADASRADGFVHRRAGSRRRSGATASLPPPRRKRNARAPSSIHQAQALRKIRLATLATPIVARPCCADANKMVSMAAIRSPGITDAEVIRAAATAPSPRR